MAEIRPVEPIQMGQMWNPNQAIQNAIGFEQLRLQQERLTLQEANQNFDNQLNQKRLDKELEFKGLFEAYKVAPPLQQAAIGNRIALVLGMQPWTTKETFRAQQGAFEGTINAIAQNDLPGFVANSSSLMWLNPQAAEYANKIAPEVFKRGQVQELTNYYEKEAARLFPDGPADQRHGWAVAMANNPANQTEFSREQFKLAKERRDQNLADTEQIRSQAHVNAFTEGVNTLRPLQTPLRTILPKLEVPSDAPLATVKGIQTGAPPSAYGEVREKAATLLPQVTQTIAALEQKLTQAEQAVTEIEGGNPGIDPKTGRVTNYAQSLAAKEATGQALRVATSYKAFLDKPNEDTYAAYQYEQANMEQRLVMERQRQQSASLGRLNLQQSEDQRKHLMEQITAEAQSKFAALPTDRQTTQGAAKIAMEMKTRYGMMPGTEDILKAVKNPNAPLVTVQNALPANEEVQKEQMKSMVKTYDQIKSAPVLLRNIEEAKALIPQAKSFMGTGGETLLEAAKFMNNRLGTKIDIQGIKGAEELRTRIFFNIMDNLKKMDAQPSQLQQMIMMDSLGKLGTDPNALGNVLDAYADVVRDRVAIYNQELRQARKFGINPPFGEIELAPKATPNQGPTGFNDPDKERRYQEWKKRQR